jgi:hypothetical protein
MFGGKRNSEVSPPCHVEPTGTWYWYGTSHLVLVPTIRYLVLYGRELADEKAKSFSIPKKSLRTEYKRSVGIFALTGPAHSYRYVKRQRKFTFLTASAWQQIGSAVEKVPVDSYVHTYIQ